MSAHGSGQGVDPLRPPRDGSKFLRPSSGARSKEAAMKPTSADTVSVSEPPDSPEAPSGFSRTSSAQSGSNSLFSRRESSDASEAEECDGRSDDGSESDYDAGADDPLDFPLQSARARLGLGCASFSSVVVDTLKNGLTPRPLYYNPADLGELGEDWAKEAHTGTGARLLTPTPVHSWKAPPAPEPIAKCLKLKLPNGQKDTYAYEALVDELREHDRATKASSFEPVLAYVREDVYRKNDPMLPYVAKDALPDTLTFESRFESGNLQSATQVRAQ